MENLYITRIRFKSNDASVGVKSPKLFSITSEVYADFSSWCESEGCYVMSKRDFASDLRSKNVVVKNGNANKVTCYNFKLVAKLNSKPISSLADMDDE